MVVSSDLMPVARVDYPATWQEFDAWFPDELAARRFFEKLRWPEGFVCPKCFVSDAWETGKGKWMCRECGRQTSVTSGTVMDRTRTPLKTWLAAIWFVCSQKNGMSAKALQQILGFKSYETAWSMMHKLRRSMVHAGQLPLGGPGVAVEIDETVIGGRSKGMSGPRMLNKSRVVVAIERQHPKGLGRVRMQSISGQIRDDVLDFAANNIAAGSIVYTDGASHYNDLTKTIDVTHEQISMVHAPDPAHVVLPTVHRVASLLKRWLAGTLHHGQSLENIDFYLNEFTFRFNRRTSHSRGLLFYRLCDNVVSTRPHPLETLKIAHREDFS